MITDERAVLILRKKLKGIDIQIYAESCDACGTGHGTFVIYFYHEDELVEISAAKHFDSLTKSERNKQRQECYTDAFLKSVKGGSND